MKRNKNLSFIIIVFLFGNRDQTQTSCPEDFSPVNDICMLSENTTSTFDNGCPYLDTLPFDIFFGIQQEINYSYWLNTKYDQISGSFKWLEKFDTYKVPLNLNPSISQIDETEKGDCLVFKNNWVFKTTHCEDKHKHLCLYQKGEGICRAYREICSKNENIDWNLQVIGSRQHNPFLESVKGCICQSNLPKKFFCQHQICRNQPRNQNQPKNSTLNLKYATLNLKNLTLNPCLLCHQFFEDYGNPTLKLFTYGEKIYLEATWHLKLARLKGTSDLSPIACRNNMLDTYGFMIPGDISLQFYYYSIWTDYRRRVFEIYPTTSFTQRIICFGFRYPDYQLVQSNIIIFERGLTFPIMVSIQKIKSLSRPNPYVEAAQLIAWDNITYEASTTKLIEADDNQLIVYAQIGLYPTYEIELAFGTILRNISYSSSLYCPNITTLVNNITLQWNVSRIGQTEPSFEMCYDQNKKFVTKTCDGDFDVGGGWSPPSGDCHNFTLNPFMVLLVEMRKITIIDGKSNIHEINEKLLEILQSPKDVTPEDVLIISKILGGVVGSNAQFSIPSFLTSVNNIMGFNEDMLRASQLLYNATDRILDALENCLVLTSKYLTQTQSFKIINDNLMAYVINLRMTNITGFQIYKNSSLNLRKIQDPGDAPEDMSEDLEVLVKIPEELLRNLHNNIDSSSVTNLIICMFKKATLFHESFKERSSSKRNLAKNASSKKDYSKVVSWITRIIVPKINSVLVEKPLQVFSKPFRRYRSSVTCGFWKFGFDDFAYAIKGFWFNFPKKQTNHKQFLKCEYFITNYFAVLLPSPATATFSIYSIICYACTLICVLVIFFTSLCFKSWQNGISTRIILNVSIVIAFKTSLMFFSKKIDSEDELCKAVGLLLHYTIISEFSWLVMLNYLLYKKLAKTNENLSEHLYIFSMVFGWIVSTTSPLFTYLFCKECYAIEEVCSISRESFPFSVLIPIFPLIFGSLGLFGVVLWNFFKKYKKGSIEESVDGRNNGVELSFAVLIFFLSVTGWSASYLDVYLLDEVFSYMFWVSASLQGGAVLFFHIKFNRVKKDTWEMWMKVVPRRR